LAHNVAAPYNDLLAHNVAAPYNDPLAQNTQATLPPFFSPYAQMNPPGNGNQMPPIQAPPVMGSDDPFILRGNNTTYPAPNAETIKADPYALSSSTYTSRTTSKKRFKWFDRQFFKYEKNRFFVYGGALIDFVFAVALGIWLHAGDLSWNLWLGSLLIALAVRTLCAGLAQKNICALLAVALGFYWFMGSWALATIGILGFRSYIIPPHIVAILVGVAGLIMHILYVLKNKK
jgi:hypothetical protein